MNNIISSNSNSDIAIKYFSKNPIIKYLTVGFLDNFKYLLNKTHPQNIIELGAGEGYITSVIATKFPQSQIISSDVDNKELKSRNHNLKNFKNIKLEIVDAKKINHPNNKFNLIVCSEVLEHIPEPQLALQEIYRTTNKWALISVPNEPIFHLLNLLRGKYIRTLGNYPDHINHWSKKAFIKFINNVGFKIVEIRTPFPWIMLLVKK